MIEILVPWPALEEASQAKPLCDKRGGLRIMRESAISMSWGTDTLKKWPYEASQEGRTGDKAAPFPSPGIPQSSCDRKKWEWARKGVWLQLLVFPNAFHILRKLRGSHP